MLKTAPKLTVRAAGRPTSLLERFSQDRGGNVAMISGLSIIFLTAIVGGAIDFGRLYTAKTHSQAALDSAALAGARTLQTTHDQAEALAAAMAAYDAMKSPIINPVAPSFSVGSDQSTVIGSLETTVATPFLRLVNIPDLAVKVQTEVGIGGGVAVGSSYEIAVMLDVTGSMCDDGSGPCTSGTKIDALKTAATDLVNIVVWPDQTTYTSRVALVPFSTRVRVGPDRGGTAMMKAMTDLDPLWSGYYRMCTSSSGSGGGESGGNWQCNASQVNHYTGWEVMPCVTDRTGAQEFTDAAPGSDAWMNAHDGGRFPKSWDSSDTAITSYTGLTAADPAEHWNYNQVDWGGGVCAEMAQGNQLMPLTNDKAALVSRIQGLTAEGSTGGALGTAMTWYTLSPNWSAVWPTGSQPAPYSDLTTIENGSPKLKKVAILMTDGVYNSLRGWSGQNQGMVSARAKQICTNMKAAGVEVYTIGFGLDQLSTPTRAIAEQTLQNCGTDINHFYNAFSAAQLQQAFRGIALKIGGIKFNK